MRVAEFCQQKLNFSSIDKKNFCCNLFRGNIKPSSCWIQSVNIKRFSMDSIRFWKSVHVSDQNPVTIWIYLISTFLSSIDMIPTVPSSILYPSVFHRSAQQNVQLWARPNLWFNSYNYASVQVHFLNGTTRYGELIRITWIWRLIVKLIICNTFWMSSESSLYCTILL